MTRIRRPSDTTCRTIRLAFCIVLFAATGSFARGQEALEVRAHAGDTVVRLSWPEPSLPEVAGYRVYRAGSPHPIHRDRLLTERYFTDIGLTNRRVYHYEVVAVSSEGDEWHGYERIEAVPLATVFAPWDLGPPWLNGQRPLDAVPTGEWQWVEVPAFDGIPSHTAPVESHGFGIHYFRARETTLEIPLGQCLVQYVFLNDEDPPEQILLKLFADELPQPIVFWGTDTIHFGDPPGLRVDGLPETGQWVRLIVEPGQLGAESIEIHGLLFAHDRGRVFWGPTLTGAVPTPAGAATDVQEDGPARPMGLLR